MKKGGLHSEIMLPRMTKGWSQMCRTGVIFLMAVGCSMPLYCRQRVRMPVKDGLRHLSSFRPSAIQYVTTNGNDSNDGLKWGTAKATIQSAYNALPGLGGIIKVGGGVFSVTSPILFDTPYKQVTVECLPGGATRLNYSGGGAMFTLDWGNNNTDRPTVGQAPGIRGCTLNGDGTGIGVETGGPNGGAVTALIEGTEIWHFSIDLDASGPLGGYLMTIRDSSLDNPVGGPGIGMNMAAPNMENIRIVDSMFSGGSTCISLSGNSGQLFVSGTSIDDCQIGIKISDGILQGFGDHFEVGNGDVSDFVFIDQMGGDLSLYGGNMADDTIGGEIPEFIISTRGSLQMYGLPVWSGQSVGALVNASKNAQGKILIEGIVPGGSIKTLFTGSTPNANIVSFP